jgi:Xaa-Pro aminopeptidase
MVIGSKSSRSSQVRRRVLAARRRAVLREARQTKSICALLVSNPVDVGYLTDFSGEDSYLLFGDSWAVLLTDGRFSEQASRECPGLELHVRTGRMSRGIRDVLVGRRVRRLGLQAEHMTLRMYEMLEKALGKTLVPISDAVAGARMVKDESELRAIRKAVRVAEDAWGDLVSQGAKFFVGRTERQIAAELDFRMRLAGADGPSFPTIVAAGANGSLPHYRPGECKIRKNQSVLIDFGAWVEGYCSDLTRVVFTGTIPPKIHEIYQVVLSAQQAGIAAVRSGVHARTVDAAARDVIRQAGYGEDFSHGLGHGLGREVHEDPGVARSCRTPLRKNMVVTIEPGLYLPGIGGVRIEDDVRVTTRGCSRLSSLPRAIEEMVLP